MKKYLFLVLISFLVFPLSTLGQQININTATLVELDQLAGIGPTYAQRIIDHRPYSSVDDLLSVKGIGSSIVQKIKDQGLACVVCQSSLENSSTTSNPPNSETPTTETTTQPLKIIINELMPAPKGADQTNEWIEFYNPNPHQVDLFEWKVKDKEGTSTTYTISQHIIIESFAYWVLGSNESKITLNNEQDGIELLDASGNIIDAIFYTKAPLNQSYARIDQAWQWSKTPTMGKSNTVSIASMPIKATTQALPKAKKLDTTDVLASLTQVKEVPPLENISEKERIFNPWPLFFSLLGASIIFGIILIIYYLKNHERS